MASIFVSFLLLLQNLLSSEEVEEETHVVGKMLLGVELISPRLELVAEVVAEKLPPLLLPQIQCYTIRSAPNFARNFVEGRFGCRILVREVIV